MRRRCTCSHCGRVLRAPLEVRVLFHQCTRPRRGPRVVVKLPPLQAPTIEEARAEAWRDPLPPQYHPLADRFHEDDLLRRLEI